MHNYTEDLFTGLYSTLILSPNQPGISVGGIKLQPLSEVRREIRSRPLPQYRIRIIVLCKIHDPWLLLFVAGVIWWR